jgi:hypothetical protein
MIICFLNGIKYKPYKSRVVLGTILCLLSDDRQKVLYRAFERCIDEVATWVWIVWVPQLISGVVKSRPESELYIRILKQMGSLYPQYLYYALLAVKILSSTNQMVNENTSNYFNEIFSSMKNSDPVMYGTLENFGSFFSDYTVKQKENLINDLHHFVTSMYSVNTTK